MTATTIDTDVCVAGGGLAGLTAALRLSQAGHRVVLLEARDRVGGRTWSETLPDGTWLDYGGMFIGPGQDRVHALIEEMGVATYAAYAEGDSLLVTDDGKLHRY